MINEDKMLEVFQENNMLTDMVAAQIPNGIETARKTD